MKRKLHLLLALGLSCSLIGCVGIGEKNSMDAAEITVPALTPFSPESITAHAQTENMARESSESNILSGSDGDALTVNTSDPWTLENPPTLIVSTENKIDSVMAERYSYTWTKKLTEDQMSAIIACGIHPLDNTSESDYAILYTAFPPGSLPPLPEGQYRSSMLPVFYLDFGEIPPETITAKRWPAEYIGSASEHYNDAEEVQIDISEGFLLPLGDGKFVYEVHADWGEVGSADYVFMTLPQVRGGS